MALSKSVIQEINDKLLLTNNNSIKYQNDSNSSSLLINSNVKSIISNNAQIVKTNAITNSTLNGKNINIPVDHVLYPGLIGVSQQCALLNGASVPVINGQSLSGEGAKFFNNAKVWHTHSLMIKGIDGKNISTSNKIYELVYNDNTYFYRLKGDKANEISITKTSLNTSNNEFITNSINTNLLKKSSYTYTFRNTSQINNELITNNTINKLINNDIYENIIIVLNMNSELCGNKSICYLKFDFYVNNLNIIYKTLYVKYYNSSGLENKELMKFTLANNIEKNMLQNGYIKVTAYQLSDLSDPNPYIIGKFKYSDCRSKSKMMTLYRFLDINKYYKFTFDNIVIYPTNISGKLYKVSGIINNTISINNVGQIINNNVINKKIFTYVLDYNNINISTNTFSNKAIIINIDNSEIWQKYYDFYCNVSFVLKNGNTYVLPYLLFNKLGNKLILNESVKIDQNKFLIKNIIKFTITYLGAKKNNEQIKLNNINLSKQGNIINN